MAGQLLGFIGIRRTAGHLLNAGYSLSIFDANPEAVKPPVAHGARQAPVAVWRRSQIGPYREAAQ